MSLPNTFDVLVIGGGAAGLFCAGQAGQRGLSVALLEHTEELGEKIRISGGGRCNFTNLHCGPANFLSQNPHFCKSALARFTPQDFLALVDSHKIGWQEKAQHPNAKGQLFCNDTAQNIIDMLLAECEKGRAGIYRKTTIQNVSKILDGFRVETGQGVFIAKALVVATGGLSIPKIGATPFGYRLAEQFGLKVIPTRPALVPLTFGGMVQEHMKALSGLTLNDASVSAGEGRFREGMLFTHRGLSGPSILQISSYWEETKPVTLDLAPDLDLEAALTALRKESPKLAAHNALARFIPSRLAEWLTEEAGVSGSLADLSNEKLAALARIAKSWSVLPSGTEGYRTAEVTAGGVDTGALSSKTFEARAVPGLYFIGEVLDVTGHLGGHNFQWAWASAKACAESL